MSSDEFPPNLVDPRSPTSEDRLSADLSSDPDTPPVADSENDSDTEADTALFAGFDPVAPTEGAPDAAPDLFPPEFITPAEEAPRIPYADMKLMRPLAEAIEQAKYTLATPVQTAVIPHAMRGQDVIGQAQTGTGKTAAFLIPFLNRWRPHGTKGPIGLVMCPTRELAMQVANEALKLAPSRKFKVVPVYGGARMGRQLEGLSKGCDLVVGTPGRIIDHLRRGSMTLHNIKYIVLDEADRMLDIGFRPDIERILKRCPTDRQTLLMSATVPDSIKRLVHKYMRNPIHLNLSPAVLTVDKIRQAYITVDEEKKFELLKRVIEREKPRQCLIFVERKRWADKLYKQLKHVVAGVAVIHGDLAQSQREKITAAFRAGKVKFLIATDVMSRGIDVEGISHVVNYDLPTDIENYVHRIGRTGRIGRDGVAISFSTPEQGGHLTDIEMTINRLIDRDNIEGFEAYTPRERPVNTVKVVSVHGATISTNEPKPAPATSEEPAAESPSSPSSEIAGWGTDDAPPELPPPPTAKKGVFGKHVKRYSNRL